MNPTTSLPLRVEFTTLTPELFRADLLLGPDPLGLLGNCLTFKDAIAPPFPSDGKNGISIFVGNSASFADPSLRLLWKLEKKRGRPAFAVVVGLKGKTFMPTLRNLEGQLGEPTLCPVSFLRRRKTGWDSLDFLTPGSAPSMSQAKPRLRRLRQAGWEHLVDRVSLNDRVLQMQYFEDLSISRDALYQSMLKSLKQCQLACLFGIAGNCLNSEHLFGLLQEPLIRQIIEDCRETQSNLEPGGQENWQLLSLREGGEVLLLQGPSDRSLKVGDILTGQTETDSPQNRQAIDTVKQFAISEIVAQVPEPPSESCPWRVLLARVQWRYPPERLIPSRWQQISTGQAG